MLKSEKFEPGDRVKVFDILLFVSDIQTPLSITMQSATVIHGNYNDGCELRIPAWEMINVRFDRENRRIKESYGHFVWGVERIK
jgi:hypothetical protein